MVVVGRGRPGERASCRRFATTTAKQVQFSIGLGGWGGGGGDEVHHIGSNGHAFDSHFMDVAERPLRCGWQLGHRTPPGATQAATEHHMTVTVT